MNLNIAINEQLPLNYKEELLYTNPTPNPNTKNIEINVDWKKYAFFTVTVKYDTSSSATQGTFTFPSGINTFIMPSAISNYIYRCSRTIKFTDNKITIYRSGSYGSIAEGDLYIPVSLYGYK